MKGKQKLRPDLKLKLIDQVKQTLRYYHYSYRTEQTYCSWIVRFLKFYQFEIHPKLMDKKEIETCLSHLALNKNVSASTQHQALNAIMFLFREVLDNSIEKF